MSATTGYRERVVQVFADRLAGCNPSNGCSFTAIVVRRRLGEEVAYVGGTVEIVTMPMQRDDGDDDQAGWCNYSFAVGVKVFAPADENGSEPLETTVDRCLCDVHRTLEIGDRMGLCEDVKLEDVEDFDPAGPEQFAGAVLTYLCRIHVHEADLAHGRTDP